MYLKPLYKVTYQFLLNRCIECLDLCSCSMFCSCSLVHETTSQLTTPHYTSLHITWILLTVTCQLNFITTLIYPSKAWNNIKIWGLPLIKPHTTCNDHVMRSPSKSMTNASKYWEVWSSNHCIYSTIATSTHSPVICRLSKLKKSWCQHPKWWGRGPHPQDCEEETQREGGVADSPAYQQ